MYEAHGLDEKGENLPVPVADKHAPYLPHDALPNGSKERTTLYQLDGEVETRRVDTVLLEQNAVLLEVLVDDN